MLIIIILSLFIDRFFCRYLCPLGGVFSLISRLRLFKIKKDNKCIGCNKCNKCNKVCPMNIDVNNKANNILDSSECINCFKCLNSCPMKALHTSSSEAINGTMASLSILGLTYVGNVIMDNKATSSIYEEKTSLGNYKDGTYMGTANGYRGEIKVIVVVKNGNISSITIDSYKDNLEFFYKAKNTIIDEIIESQSTNVKTVSGATYSSKGIINAVINAISGNLNDSTLDNKIDNNINEEASDDENKESTKDNSSLDFNNLSDGNYFGTGKGRNGNIEVNVSVDNGKVVDITIISSKEDA